MTQKDDKFTPFRAAWRTPSENTLFAGGALETSIERRDLCDAGGEEGMFGYGLDWNKCGRG